MKRLVLDNSVVIAWILEEGSAAADAIIGMLGEVHAVAPSIWPLELANVILASERRGRISEAEAARARDIGANLGVEVVPDHPPRVMTEVLALARLHGLTVYDASYLDLAMREGPAPGDGGHEAHQRGPRGGRAPGRAVTRASLDRKSCERTGQSLEHAPAMRRLP